MATMDSPRQNQRRAQLQKLIEEAGHAADLSRLTGTPKTHISAILAGRRGIGDQLAAKLEAVMGKPAGWMDQAADMAAGYPAPSATATVLQAREPAPQAEDALSGALETLARAASRLGTVERRQVAALLSLLAEEPAGRQATCAALMRLLQPPVASPAAPRR
jgi:plasmid maintenance system antidote protein VapI